MKPALASSITTHYSAAERRELAEAMELIATDNLQLSWGWHHLRG